MGGRERGGELAGGRARPVRQRHCLLPPRSLGWGLEAGARPAAAIPAQQRPAHGPAPARGGTQPRPGEVSPRINFSPPPPRRSLPFPPPRSLALFPVAPAQFPPRRLGPRASTCPAAPRREARRAEEGREGRGRSPPWRADGGRTPPGERRARGPRGDGGASSRRGKLKLLTAAFAELHGAGGAGRKGTPRSPCGQRTASPPLFCAGRGCLVPAHSDGAWRHCGTAAAPSRKLSLPVLAVLVGRKQSGVGGRPKSFSLEVVRVIDGDGGPAGRMMPVSTGVRLCLQAS